MLCATGCTTVLQLVLLTQQPYYDSSLKCCSCVCMCTYIRMPFCWLWVDLKQSKIFQTFKIIVYLAVSLTFDELFCCLTKQTGFRDMDVDTHLVLLLCYAHFAAVSGLKDLSHFHCENPLLLLNCHFLLPVSV